MDSAKNPLWTSAWALALGGLLATCPACNKSSDTVTADEVSYSGRASGDRVSSALDNLADDVDSLDQRVTALEEAAPPAPVGNGNPGSSGGGSQAGGNDLEARVAELEKPIPDDRQLVQLRKDVEASRRQLANRRLTAVQDLAWALINSPAFLFNH